MSTSVDTPWVLPLAMAVTRVLDVPARVAMSAGVSRPDWMIVVSETVGSEGNSSSAVSLADRPRAQPNSSGVRTLTTLRDVDVAMQHLVQSLSAKNRFTEDVVNRRHRQEECWKLPALPLMCGAEPVERAMPKFPMWEAS